MRKLFRWVPVGCFSLWTVLLAQQTPLSINGQLRVCDTNLCNQHGNPIQLRGMATHGLQWFPWGDCLNKNSLDALAEDWGADVLRISNYIQEGGWETDPDGFNDQVDRLVDEARDRGMYAIIDFHLLTPGDPNVNLDNARTFFDRMASRHGSKGHVLYEIANEPNGDDVDWARIKTYADQVIPVIRNHDEDGVILVGTPGWSSLGESGGGTWLDIPQNPLTDPNVMYVFHFYAASHNQSYMAVLNAAANQLPMFVTEFGTQDYTGDGTNDFQSAGQWLDYLAEQKISWVNWNFSDDFRSGAVWQTGNCPDGPWTENQLKEAGRWIRNRMRTQDDFPVTAKRPAQDFAGESFKFFVVRNGFSVHPNHHHPYGVSVSRLDGKLVEELAGKPGKSVFILSGTLSSGAYLLKMSYNGRIVKRVLAVP